MLHQYKPAHGKSKVTARFRTEELSQSYPIKNFYSSGRSGRPEDHYKQGVPKKSCLQNAAEPKYPNQNWAEWGHGHDFISLV